MRGTVDVWLCNPPEMVYTSHIMGALTRMKLWCCVVLVLLVPGIIFAQPAGGSGGKEIPRPRPEEGVALLARGPYQERGLVFISTNVINYRAGEYRFHQGDVTVIFPSVTVFLDETWEAAGCGTAESLVKNINESVLRSSVVERVYMVEQENGQIFFHFRGSNRQEECPFIERFLLRYDWFSRISDDPGRLSLPAVVEYGE